MTVLRYGGLLIVGIMLLTGCGLIAAKDQPIDQPTQSATVQPPASGSPAAKDRPADRPAKRAAEPLPASGSPAAKDQPADRPTPSRAEQLPASGSPAAKDHPVDQPTLSGSEQLLAQGIKNYEEGEYKAASKYLQNALKAGLPQKTDSAKAHKYLAFIACSSNNTRRCRDEFRKAFKDDPNFALDAAEAGHPVWGPVYEQVLRDQVKSKKKPR